jgi:hypothetical protein
LPGHAETLLLTVLQDFRVGAISALNTGYCRSATRALKTKFAQVVEIIEFLALGHERMDSHETRKKPYF